MHFGAVHWVQGVGVKVLFEKFIKKFYTLLIIDNWGTVISFVARLFQAIWGHHKVLIRCDNEAAFSVLESGRKSIHIWGPVLEMSSMPQPWLIRIYSMCILDGLQWAHRPLVPLNR